MLRVALPASMDGSLGSPSRPLFFGSSVLPTPPPEGPCGIRMSPAAAVSKLPDTAVLLDDMPIAGHEQLC